MRLRLQGRSIQRFAVFTPAWSVDADGMSSVAGAGPWRGDSDEERADPPVVSSISKLKLSRDLAVACSFNAFFRNATKKEAAGAARDGCQVGELGLACATAMVGRGSCDGRHNGYGRGSPALVDLDAAPRQSSSTSPSALPLMRRSALGARSSEREVRSPGDGCCSVEDDDAR